MNLPIRNYDQDEDGLTSSEQISIYAGLVRVIEEDVKFIQARNSREGWTLVGVLGLLVASFAGLFRQLSEITELPLEAGKFGAVSLMFLYLLWATFNMLSGQEAFPKPGRVIPLKEFLRGRVFFFVLRGLILMLLSWFLKSTDFSSASITACIILILIPYAYGILSVIAMHYTKRPFGNNPNFAKAKPFINYLPILCYGSAVSLLASQLLFPVGPGLTRAYIIGFLMSAIVVLLELFLALAGESANVSALIDLRDDLIIRDISLNEAIVRYRIIREGKSLWDEMQPDYEEIMQELRHQDAIYDEQTAIVNKQVELVTTKFLPEKSEQETKQLETDLSALTKSFGVHNQEVVSSVGRVTPKIEPFFTKLRKVTDATGDTVADTFIRSTLDTAFNRLRERETQINQLNQKLVELLQRKVTGGNH